jgi:hypothetical protein
MLSKRNSVTSSNNTSITSEENIPKSSKGKNPKSEEKIIKRTSPRKKVLELNQGTSENPIEPQVVSQQNQILIHLKISL